MMTRFIFSFLCVFLYIQNGAALNQCLFKHGGTCISTSTTCCKTELLEGKGLCASDDVCCLPPDSCISRGGVCKPAKSSCGFLQGSCPFGKVCCSHSGAQHVGIGTAAPNTLPPFVTKKPKDPGNIPPNTICNPIAKRIACEVNQDPNIKIMTGQDLLDYGWTITKDGSAPQDNMDETCEGKKILTSTTLCGGKYVCLHHKVPIFLKCMSILCKKRFTTINIASDSNGPLWQLHCKGIAVDASIPFTCPEDQVIALCKDIGGTPRLFESGDPSIENLIHCHFA